MTGIKSRDDEYVIIGQVQALDRDGREGRKERRGVRLMVLKEAAQVLTQLKYLFYRVVSHCA